MYTSCRAIGKVLWPLLLISVAFAAQTITFTITKPTGYSDGTAFGTEQLVYLVYDADTNKQLFSTFNLVVTKSDIPDTTKCVYAKAGVYDLTNNAVLAGTLSDASPSSCKVVPPPVVTPKKVGIPAVKWG